jgi:hypothetical protein
MFFDELCCFYAAAMLPHGAETCSGRGARNINSCILMDSLNINNCRILLEEGPILNNKQVETLETFPSPLLQSLPIAHISVVLFLPVVSIRKTKDRLGSEWISSATSLGINNTLILPLYSKRQAKQTQKRAVANICRFTSVPPPHLHSAFPKQAGSIPGFSNNVM